jgi:hypothetical protein
MNIQPEHTSLKSGARLKIEGFEPSGDSPNVARPRAEKKVVRVGQIAAPVPVAQTGNDPSVTVLRQIQRDITELKQEVVREASQSRPSGDTIGANPETIDTQLKAVAQSVEFIEAYVTVGLTARLGEILRDEAATSRLATAKELRLKQQVWTAILLFAAVLFLLVAELSGDLVSTAWTASAVQFEANIAPSLGNFGTWAVHVLDQGFTRLRELTSL